MRVNAQFSTPFVLSRVGFLAVGALPIAGAVWFSHGGENPLSHCLFQALMGFPSPACGMTRSFVALVSGDVSTALLYHAFGPLVFSLCLLLACNALIELMLMRSLWAYPLRVMRRPLITAVPLISFAFFAYYLLRLYVRYHEAPFGGMWAHQALWQQFVTGAQLL